VHKGQHHEKFTEGAISQLVYQWPGVISRYVSPGARERIKAKPGWSQPRADGNGPQIRQGHHQGCDASSTLQQISPFPTNST